MSKITPNLFVLDKIIHPQFGTSAVHNFPLKVSRYYYIHTIKLSSTHTFLFYCSDHEGFSCTLSSKQEGCHIAFATWLLWEYGQGKPGRHYPGVGTLSGRALRPAQPYFPAVNLLAAQFLQSFGCAVVVLKFDEPGRANRQHERKVGTDIN